MNKKIYSYISIAAIAAVFILTGCKKYLSREPLDTITSQAFYSNANEVNQALTGVYNAYGARTVAIGVTGGTSEPTSLYAKMDLFTEIGLERGLTNTIASGSYTPTNGAVTNIWFAFYQVIQRSNILLLNMERARSVMTVADYRRVEAEAKTLRALAYWYLVVYFGDVPYFTAPASNNEITSGTRTPKRVIINSLINELSVVCNDLPWLPTEAGRVSKGVALGAAARLAMEDKRFNDAANITDSIISRGPYGLNPVFQNVFRLNGQRANTNNEIMFIYPYGDADAGSFNYLNLVQGSRNQGGQSSHFPSQFLVDLFECRDGLNIATSPLYNPAAPGRNRDPRMAATVIVPGDTSIVQGFTSVIFNFTDRFQFQFNPTTRVITYSSTANQDSANIFGPRANGLGNLWRKYTNDRDINGNAGNLFKVGWVNMRFSEMLLINAEAKLEAGRSANEVAASINRVRTRVGMPMVSPTVLASTQLLRQLVRREKTIELANEGLHMADMRRWDDGAYAFKVMNNQMYGQSTSRMTLIPGLGVTFNTPPTTPIFDATYGVPTSWPNAETERLRRELRVFIRGQHNLCPIPQSDIDRTQGSLVQNPGW